MNLRALDVNQRRPLQLKPLASSSKSFSFFVFVFCLSAILVPSGCSGLTSSASAPAPPATPSITTEPSSQTIVAGQTATFSVTASGTAPLTYQWYKDGTAISSAASSTYTTPAETTSDNGAKFSVTVSNMAGSTTSTAATLTVNASTAAPSITTEPSSQTIVSGQTATFSVNASGTAPLTYQWYKDGTAISSAASSTYTTPAETTSDNGAKFSVTVSNAAGSATSTPATLTVNASTAAPSITTEPSSQTIVAGQTATFSVTASGTAPLTYQWYKDGTAISSAASSTYTTPAETTSDNGAKFSVTVSNVAGSATSTAAALTVNAATGLPGPWISGYYSAQNGVLPVSAIPWTKYTHILHFAAAPGVDSGGNGDGTVEMHYLTQTEINQIVAAAHTAGKKIIVTIKDNNSHLGAYAQSTAPALLATFVSNIAAFVNSNGYDGVDFDWEQQLNTAQYESLLASMRSTFGSTKLITAAMGEWSSMPSIAATSYANLDQINIMCYDMESDRFSWHNDALFQNGDTAKMTCDWRVGYFTRAGVPNAKIGIGIPFYGYQFTGCTVPLVAGCAHGPYSPYRSIVTNATWWNGGANHHWDATYSADYLSVSTSNQFITYTDTMSLQAIVNWQKTQGFGGFMTFTLEYEYLSTQTGDAGHPLSTTLCQTALGTCP